MRDVAQAFKAESGKPHLDGGETANIFRMHGSESEDRCSANILPREVHRTYAELPDELMQILSRSRAVIIPLVMA